MKSNPLPAVGDKVKILVGGYANDTAKVTRIFESFGQVKLTLYTQSGLTLWGYKTNQVEILKGK